MVPAEAGPAGAAGGTSRQRCWRPNGARRVLAPAEPQAGAVQESARGCLRCVGIEYRYDRRLRTRLEILQPLWTTRRDTGGYRRLPWRRASVTVARWLLAVTIATFAATACSGGGEHAAVLPATTTTADQPTSSTTVLATSQPPIAAAADNFQSVVSAIDDATAARMTASWRPGCPVPLDELRILTLTHWGFDLRPRQGELVVAATYAEDIVSVFRRLFDSRFPIESMRLVDEFGGDDDRSMAANNTSAFNCRPATGSTRWSEHAYGRAVDVNPIQNPYVTRSGAVLPPAGVAHTTRDPATPGLITDDSLVVAGFHSIGWLWGGDWSSGKDYQHFSATGR